MVAEIVSIGTELLLGELIDTNSAWLSGELRDRGVFVFFKDTVGDNRNRIRDTILRALERSDLILLSGGLGPTDDDLTREGIADAVGETPREDPRLLEELRKMFSSRERTMSETNRKQIWVIPSAEPLDNPIGTAWGWFVKHSGKIIVAMPGPPIEMKRMWREQVLQRLSFGQYGFWHTTVHTLGIGESNVGEILAEFTDLKNPSVATYARRHGVDVRVAASSGSLDDALKLAEPTLCKVERLLAKFIWGHDEDTIGAVLGKILKERGEMVAVAESVTGGLVADSLTDCPGSSGWFLGGFVAYSNGAKRLAGVRAEAIERYGVVSEGVALSLAKGVRRKLGADWGLATTGVAGPEPLAGQPVGLAFVAIAGPQGTWVRKLSWPGERRQVKERVSNWLLMLFLRALKGELE